MARPQDGVQHQEGMDDRKKDHPYRHTEASARGDRGGRSKTALEETQDQSATTFLGQTSLRAVATGFHVLRHTSKDTEGTGDRGTTTQDEEVLDLR